MRPLAAAVILYLMNRILLCALLLTSPAVAYAIGDETNQDCKAAAIETAAAVETSYGSAYGVETYYRTPEEAAARFISDKPALMVVEGPLVWVKTAQGETLGGDNERRFVIGHQFHALALRFDEIMSGVEKVKNIDFKGETYKGRKGRYPEGGEATLVVDHGQRPVGLLLELPDETRIEVSYEDWRETSPGVSTPYTAQILHNGNLFTYRYADVTFREDGPEAFRKAFPAPSISAVADYRAKRAAETARCAEN